MPAAGTVDGASTSDASALRTTAAHDPGVRMGVLDVLFVVGVVLIVFFVIWCVQQLIAQDRWRRDRPHPTPEEGGRSFGDTTHWGGWGRPGT